MRRWISTLFFLAASVGFVEDGGAADVAAAEVSAAQVTAAEAKQVRGVIEAQLKALAADDAKTAFSFAAPGVRQMFGTADQFIDMVRSGYPVVYRPSSVAFLKAEKVEGGIVQAVHMTDADGTLWLARYRLERQPDKSWRISACEVVPAEGRVA